MFTIDTVECLVGELPVGPRRLVEAWAEIRSTQVNQMQHPIHRVVSFAVVAPHTVRVAFNDGTEQCIDFRPVLHGPLFGPLQAPHVFNAVTLDSEAGTLVWPNGAQSFKCLSRGERVLAPALGAL